MEQTARDRRGVRLSGVLEAMHIVKRLLLLPVLLGLISLIAFALVRMAPGGPFDRERKPASPEIERRIRAKYHLDEPLSQQYGRYLTGLLQGDLGPSLKYRNHSVSEIVAVGLPVSMTLGLCAGGLALALGVPLGLCSMASRNGLGAIFWNWTAVTLVCVPGFIMGPLLIMTFAVRWQWFPVALLESPRHFVLPVVALGLFFAGRVARLTREGVSEAFRSGFVTAARARGIGERAILLRHTLPIGILPVVSYSGPMLADLLTGSFVVENLFQIPGIGVFMVNSSLSRDYPMIVGLVLIYAVVLLLLNLAVDAVAQVLDPRIRHAS